MLLRPGPFRGERPDWRNCGASGASGAAGATGATGAAAATGNVDCTVVVAAVVVVVAVVVPARCCDCWPRSTNTAANLPHGHRVQQPAGLIDSDLCKLPGLEAVESMS